MISLALTALHDTLKAGDEPFTVLVTVTPWTLEVGGCPFATENTKNKGIIHVQVHAYVYSVMSCFWQGSESKHFYNSPSYRELHNIIQDFHVQTDFTYKVSQDNMMISHLCIKLNQIL